MKRYVLNQTENIKRFPCPEGISPILHNLLMARGVRSAEEARAFLNPSLDALHDPYLLNDMDRVVARLKQAVADGEQICIYGDYDVDGICASTILNLYLNSIGGHARVYLPSRHNEGYGLNDNAVREIANEYTLLITVDCGITNNDQVALLTSLGVDVLVTDHHRPAEQLPDAPCVNPLLNNYPFPFLCGAGVAWKVVCAMGGLQAAMAYIDVAALATVADIVSLRDENRVIVTYGLRALNRHMRPGLAALTEVAHSRLPITAATLAFQFAPRLNAGGRLGDANRSRMLLSETDPLKALEQAIALENENTQRKTLENHMIKSAEEQLKGFNFAAHRAIIVCGKDWNPGVIGLTASRLVEEYHYPAIVLSETEGTLTGSCRSIDGVDIHQALTSCADLFTRFGGHRMAAGLSMAAENLPAFRERLDDYLRKNIPANVYIPTEKYDLTLSLGQVNKALISELAALEPTGCENPMPVLRLADAEITSAWPVGRDLSHLKLNVLQNGIRMDGIAYRKADQAEAVNGQTVDLLFTPELNVFRERETVQLHVQSIGQSGARQKLLSRMEDEADLQCMLLTDLLDGGAGEAREPDMMAPLDLRGQLAIDPQGTLILTMDMESAAYLLNQVMPVGSEIPIAEPDAFAGEIPQDARAFNAICVCPRAGRIPEGYRRVVLAGMPWEYPVPQGMDVYCVETWHRWLAWLPSLDDVRTVYRMVRYYLNAQPNVFADLRAMTRALASVRAMEPQTITASLMALRDMGLLDFDAHRTPVRLTLIDKPKADPDQSRVWRTICLWKGQTGVKV